MTDTVRELDLQISASFYPLLEVKDRYLVMAGGKGSGKCLGAGTRIIMFDGSTKAVEDVVPQDILMGPDSTPRIVESITAGFGPLYKVTQNKGIDYIVNESHVLSLKKSRTCHKDKGHLCLSGNYRHQRGRYPNEPDYVSIPILDYLKKTKKWKSRFLGYRAGVNWPEQPVLIDPYFLGLWLGDGRCDGPAITTADKEVEQYIRQYAENTGHLVHDETKTEMPAHSFRVSRGRQGKASPLMLAMNHYGLIKNKHIPQEYIANSRLIRLALIAGLLDTDGHLCGNCYEITQKNENLARQIVFLCHSLGLRASLRPTTKTIRSIGFSGEYWRINISGNTQDIPCRIERKKVKKYNKLVDPQVTGISVTPCGYGPFFGFDIDGDRLFLLEDFTVTHNSEFAARKLFIRCLNEGGHRFLVLRKVRKTAHESTLRVMRTLLKEQGVEFTHDKTHQIISFPSSEGAMNEIRFDGLDEPEKIKSIKAITGVWIEEATEFTERDFLEVDLSLREPTAFYKQIILSFNPDESLAPWLKKRFFPDDPKGKDPRAYTHGSTIEDNPIDELRVEYLAQLDAIADETTKKIYRYGIWAQPKGQIYNWTTVPSAPPNPDEIIYGLDFGYSVNPSALIRISRKADEFYVETLVYEPKLVNQDLGNKMREARVRYLDYVYADSAEPKSIDEIRGMGFNIIPSQKGADSVRAGIDFLRSQKIFIVEGSSDIIKEVSTYKWKTDKNDDPLPEPVKFNDHCLVAGTLVTTDRGDVPIEAVTTTDLVLTRDGWRRVLQSGMTLESALVMTVQFSNGATLTGTPDHRVWTENRGFIPLDTMRYDDIIKVCGKNELGIKEPHTAPVYVRRVIAEPDPQPVFDLTVEQTPEFYANGVLVHNSLDAIRYAIFTHMKQAGGFAGTLKHSVYPD